jgi:hypothetical protein
VSVDLRLIAKDAAGRDTLFANARLRDPEAAGFQPLVIAPRDLPPDTVRVEVQLSVTAREDGGRALVFWDGIELGHGLAETDPEADPPLTGDLPGARWEGAPHASASLRDGAIDRIEVTFDPDDPALAPQRTTLHGPFRPWDTLAITGDRLTVAGRDGTVRATKAMPELAATGTLTLDIAAPGRVRLVPVTPGATEGTLPTGDAR